MKACVNTINNALNFINRHRSMFDAGKPFTIEIKPFKQPRTLSQNSKIHAMMAEIAEVVGHSPADIKEYMKAEYAPRIAIEVGGRIIDIPLGTSDMSLEQLSDFIEHIYQVGAMAGVIFQEDIQND